MKPQKSVYWITTIIFSYAVLGGIASAIIGALVPATLHGLVQTIVGAACQVVAVWAAAAHIIKRSSISSTVIIKTVIAVMVVCAALGALFALVGGAATIPLSIVSAIVLGGSSYFFLSRAA